MPDSEALKPCGCGRASGALHPGACACEGACLNPSCHAPPTHALRDGELVPLGAPAGYSERAYALWAKRLAEAEAEVERYELRLSRILGRLLTARKRARVYRRKMATAEEEVARGQAEVSRG